MNLEDMVLSERARYKGPHIIGLCLYEMSQTGKSVESRKQANDCQWLGVGRRGMGSDC